MEEAAGPGPENTRRKGDLERRLQEALVEAQVASRPAWLGGRELALVITKLQEAQYWASRINVGPDGTPDGS